MDLKLMEQKLNTMLRSKRLAHSIGVRDVAVDLAQKWGADSDKAAVAGLLHDCAKHLTDAESRTMLEDIRDKVDDIILSEKGLWHAPLGAELAQTEFEVCDCEIIDAIFYHTIGKANMPLLTKIVYIADMIEQGRDSEFKFAPALRKLAFENLNEAIIQSIDYTIKSIIQRGLQLHPSTVEARNSLILELRQRRENNG